MKKYGLRHKKTGNIIGFDVSSNGDDADFCGDLEYSLCEYEKEKIWMVDTPEHATWVAENSTKWYNAGYNTPNHNFKSGELEVIEIEIIESVKPLEVKLPTGKEIIETVYANDPQKDMLMKTVKEYSLYNYKDYLKIKEKQNA